MRNTKDIISVFTDGSCNHQGIGGWAAIIFAEDGNTLLSGRELSTTHQRMELVAAVKAIQYLEKENLTHGLISISTDSQYLVNLPSRKNHLTASGFITRNHHPVRNADLIAQLFRYLDTLNLEFVKVKAHAKPDDNVNYNRVVDKAARKIVREYVTNCTRKPE